MTRECPPDEQLFALALGELEEGRRASIEEHVRSCPSCRDVLSEVLHSLSSGAEGSAELEDVPLVHLNRYELRKVIGSGGAGIVYLAFDPTMHRQVAVKLLRPSDDSSPQLRRKLLREARAIAKLSHPHVVTAYDVGESELGVFIVLEYHPGGSLESFLHEEHSFETILSLLLQAGAGLRAAHEQGVVHRDFKPHNVLIGAQGQACVTDFGLANFDDESEKARFRMDSTIDAATQTRGVMGTPTYMAPEVLAGGRADERADQFSFCVTAYVAFNGRHPFGVTPASTLSELIARVRGELYHECAEHIPVRVAQALERGLSARPEDRFPDMAALLAELEAGGRPRGRFVRRALVGGAAGACVLALAVFAGAPKKESKALNRPTANAAASREEIVVGAQSPASNGPDSDRESGFGEQDKQASAAAQPELPAAEKGVEEQGAAATPRPKSPPRAPKKAAPKKVEKQEERYEDWLRDPF